MPLNPDWSYIEKIIFRFFFVFVLLFINSFSFPHEYIPDIGNYTSPFFELLVKWSAETIFSIHPPYTSQLISDSTGLYIHTIILLTLSGIICAAWTLFDRSRKNYQTLSYWFFVIVRYYLAMQLFSYGCNKIFKWQFYMPEPNTLFTTLGNTYQDLLYWSTMGTSRPYTVFLGVTEALSAFLLLFRRTQLAGALIAIGIMINVIAINFSFDISVKLYSCFLLLLCLIITVPDARRLLRFFILNKPVDSNRYISQYNSQKKKWLYAFVKTVVIGIILADTLAMYIKANNFNDDLFPRPSLHGAYDVSLFVKNNDTLIPLVTDTCRWKRMFIHGRGYLITQLMNDEMEDYSLEYDTINRTLLIENYGDSVKTALHYVKENDSLLIVSGILNKDTLTVGMKKINMDKLPLLQKEFHWTIDY